MLLYNKPFQINLKLNEYYFLKDKYKLIFNGSLSYKFTLLVNIYKNNKT